MVLTASVAPRNNHDSSKLVPTVTEQPAPCLSVRLCYKVASVFDQLAEWGLEGIGDYGAFVFLGAMAKLQHRIGRSGGSDSGSGSGSGGGGSGSRRGRGAAGGDDGSALIAALAKCDVDSWCHEIDAFNATMTIESLTKSPFAEGQVHRSDKKYMTHPPARQPASQLVSQAYMHTCVYSYTAHDSNTVR